MVAILRVSVYNGLHQLIKQRPFCRDMAQARDTAECISIKKVRDLLYEVRLKWYDLGIELEVEDGELDEIKSKNKDDHGACLRDMIRARLRFIWDPLTWSHIADALSARAINELELAERGNLEKKWTT